MTPTKMKLLGASVGLLAMGLAFAPATTSACIAMDFDPDSFARDPLLLAALTLSSDDYETSVAYADGAAGDLDQIPADAFASLDDPFGDTDRHLAAQHVAALAIVRAEGRVGPAISWGGETEEQRAHNVMWAAFVLQFHTAVRPDDPLMKVHFAEAAAAVPSLEPAAYAILHDLSEQDVMPDADGYALLARLQRARGDAAGVEVSMQRLVAMGGEADSPEVV